MFKNLNSFYELASGRPLLFNPTAIPMRTALWTLLMILPFFLIGCGSDAPANEADETSQTFSNNNNDNNDDDDDVAPPPGGLPSAMKGLQDQLKQVEESMSGTTTAEPIDFEVLLEMLPTELDDLEFVDSEGESTSALGMSVSNAHVRFRGENGERLKMSVTDTGSMRGMALMGYQWLAIDFNRRNSRGYERTTEYKGYKAFQKFEERSTNNSTAELHFLVGDRFIVQIDGDNVKMEQVEDAADKIPTGKLEGMKDVGVEKK